MKKLSISLLFAFVLVCAPFCRSYADTTTAAAESAWADGGLKKINTKGLDVVYAMPGASLAQYTKVMLRPVTVSFHKDWERNMRNTTKVRVRPNDLVRIRENLATLMREEVTKQLNEGGYKLVDAPGEDVLDVEMAIVNLSMTAPDARNASTTTYAVSAGELTLVVELRDSISGDPIARAMDRALARENFQMMRITNADNVAEARIATSAWAKALRRALDLAKAPGGY